MRSNTARAAVVLGTIGVAIALFVVLSGGDDDEKSPTTPTRPSTTERATSPTGATGPTRASEKPVTITVAGAKPVGGVERLEHTKGERVRFVVRSDVADEVHVHGYDRSKDVSAGGSVRFDFPAMLEGIFEIELESRKEQIGELRVKP
jgi:hypothetical protein